MVYDKESILNLDRIESNLKLELAMDENSYTLLISLLNNLPEGINYDLTRTYVKIIGSSPANVILSDITYSLLEEGLDSGYFINSIGSGTINLLPGVTKLRILGRIYLTNNTYFVLNRKLNQPEILVNTYYNLSNF